MLARLVQSTAAMKLPAAPNNVVPAARLPIEDEIDFFRTELGEHGPFSELLSLRREHQPSFAFIRRCFGTLIQLYFLTARENEFPITVELT